MSSDIINLKSIFIFLKMQNKVLETCDFSVSPWESAAVPRKILHAHCFKTILYLLTLLYWENICSLSIQRNWEANKNISAKNCIIYETPPRLLASHNSLGSNLWLKRLISQKIKAFTGKWFGELRGHQLLQSKPRRDCETQCILQCYTQQRKDSNSRKILLTSKRSLSYASKDF